MTKYILLILSLFFSSLVSAHSGHDHSSPAAFFVHLLWLAPVAIAALVAYFLLKKRSDRGDK